MTTPHEATGTESYARLIVIDAPATTLRFYRDMRACGFTRTSANLMTFGYAVKDGARVAYGAPDITVSAVLTAPGSTAATPTDHGPA